MIDEYPPTTMYDAGKAKNVPIPYYYPVIIRSVLESLVLSSGAFLDNAKIGEKYVGSALFPPCNQRRL